MIQTVTEFLIKKNSRSLILIQFDSFAFQWILLHGTRKGKTFILPFFSTKISSNNETTSQRLTLWIRGSTRHPTRLKAKARPTKYNDSLNFET